MKKLPISPIHNFMDQIFSKYKSSPPSKPIDISLITFDNHSNFLLKDFLLDNVEEDSANRNELRRSPLHNLKASTTSNKPLIEDKQMKLVNYDDEEEDITKSSPKKPIIYI